MKREYPPLTPRTKRNLAQNFICTVIVVVTLLCLFGAGALGVPR